MKRFKEVLREYITPVAYDALMERVDIENVLETLRLFQDGILEEIKLQAVVVDRAKWLCRLLWVNLTRWKEGLKDKVKRFPATGDGTICGPKPKKSLKEYKLTSKTLKHREDVTNGTSSSKSFSGWPVGSRGRKRGSGT